MKKLITSVLALVAMAASGNVKADNITLEQAQEASAYFLGNAMAADKLSAADLHLIYQIDNLDLNIPALYIFNAGCGWIAMAGTTVNDPVIAYSIKDTLDINRVSPSMWWWLNSYAADIMEVQLMDAENDYPDSPEWQNIVYRKLAASKDENKIQLLDSEWDQGETSPARAVKSYNRFCPQASNGKYSVTGCVATALSQLIYYYRYPVKPKSNARTWFGNTLLKVDFDTVTYDYSIMPRKLPSTMNNAADSAAIFEVAKLCYHVGLAVQMDYDPDGSSSTNYYARSGMMKNFKYQSPTNVDRQGTSDTSFVNKVRRELVNKNVVYMTGKSSTGGGADAAGHAWVVAGYEANNESWLYFNWGWGPSSGNGWYNLRTNQMRNTRTGYTFDTDQSILLGLVPPADSIHSGPTSISHVDDNTLLGTAYPNPATLSVYLPYNVDHASELNVYSMDGKLVATRRVEAGSGNVEMKVVGMPAGIYIYRLNSQSGKFMVR